MCHGSPSWVWLPGTMTKCNGTLQYLPLKAEPSRPKRSDWISHNKSMPPNPNETLAEWAERIEAELMAAEQEAAEELMRKRDALRRARAQRSLEEAAQRVCEEEARKAQEAREEAERQAQEEAREATRRRVLGENEANAHPEEDGDFVFEDAMDIDDGAASPSKRKKATKVLVARTGDQRCRGCVSRKTACLVDEARVKKWKQLVAE